MHSALWFAAAVRHLVLLLLLLGIVVAPLPLGGDDAMWGTKSM